MSAWWLKFFIYPELGLLGCWLGWWIYGRKKPDA